MSRALGLDLTRGRKAFILPKIAIIDGNPNNFVKDAFGRFANSVNNVMANEEDEHKRKDLMQLVELIGNTTVLGLGKWADGCANSLVGEAVTTANLTPVDLRNRLGVDDRGNLKDKDGKPVYLPVSIFLVVSSGGGATGSGGGVYLTKAGTLFSPAGEGAQADGPNHAIVTHAVVLPSRQASSDNKKYALNAGRALARHGNEITATEVGSDGYQESSSVILFSNPRDEGDPRALQCLNNYLSEFAIRVANFTFPGSVAGITRDVDTRELGFLSGKTCVLAMSHLAEEVWDEENLESTLVERALADLYASGVDKPCGLSVESGTAEHAPASVLATASSAMVVVGVPPKFEGPLKIGMIADCLKEYSGSRFNSGISSFAYGSAKHLELTVFLRYRTMKACPLAVHFVDQYVGTSWDVDVDKLRETEHIRTRANRDEQDDEYAETFEGFAKDVRELSGSLDFDAYVVHRPPVRRATASVPVSDEQEPEGNA